MACEKLTTDEQLFMDLMRYMLATEGELVPAHCNAPAGKMGVNLQRLEAAFCAVKAVLAN